MVTRLSWLGWLPLVCGALAFSGCRPAEPPPVYSLRQEIADLPAKGLPEFPADEMSPIDKAWAAAQVEWIDGTLRDYFGAPLQPRRKVLDAAGESLRTLAEAPREEPASESQRISPAKLNEERLALLRLTRGAAIFQQQCQQCHGTSGDGAGPAAADLLPRPRDYRLGIYKFTSTPRGSPPRRQDLARIIQYGAKGTSMPSFRWMDHEDLRGVVDYVVHLSQRGQLEKQLLEVVSGALLDGLPTTPEELKPWEEETWQPYRDAELHDRFRSIVGEWSSAEHATVQPLAVEPPYSLDSVALGRTAFLTQGCSKCHGDDGRGRTQDNVGQDAWGHATNAADLTSGMLHGGRRSIDLYRRIHAGINGTPMPSFADALAQQPETMWHLVHYVQAVSTHDPLLKDLPPPIVPADPVANPEEPAVAVEPAEPAVDAEPPANPDPPPRDPAPTDEAPKDEAPKDEAPNDAPSPEPDESE